jgi:predicted tellurium resistance membrane protein TerC
VLLWGILIALVLRAIFIFAGAEALETYSWVAWPFAALLAWTGWRILRSGDEHDEGAKIVERIRAAFPGLSPRSPRWRRGARRRDLRGRLGAGDPRHHHRHVHRLQRQRVRAARPARAVLPRRRAPSRASPTCSSGSGVLLIGIAGKLVYGELTGEKIPTALTLGAILGVLTLAIGASLLKERRSPPAEVTRDTERPREDPV